MKLIYRWFNKDYGQSNLMVFESSWDSAGMPFGNYRLGSFTNLDQNHRKKVFYSIDFRERKFCREKNNSREKNLWKKTNSLKREL